MLTAPLLRRRVASLPWLARDFAQAPGWRHISSDRPERRNDGPRKKKNDNFYKPRAGSPRAADFCEPNTTQSTKSEGPSLLEQLFPEEEKRYQEKVQQDARPDVPRLPLDTRKLRHPNQRLSTLPPTMTPGTSEWRRTLEAQRGTTPTLLVLRNASKNLVDEDFRRLIPQGLHVEGWALDQGDIVKVIPGRELATLRHQGVYYLLFSNALSANAYQEHVTRVHRLVAAHMPTSSDSPMLPPPGFLNGDLDVNAAIASFSLVPPSQKLQLRMLQPPLTPMLEGMIRNQGYHSIVNRLDKAPFEARLTLDGPQLSLSSIRAVLHDSVKDRGLSWSGDHDNANLRVTKWEPRADTISGKLEEDISIPPHERTEAAQLSRDLAKSEGIDVTAPVGVGGGMKLPERRAALKAVYVVGFQSQEALSTFVMYWHQRPMEVRKRGGRAEAADRDRDEESPPVALVEVLW